MLTLGPDETLLTGSWIEVDGGVRGDATCLRIHELVKSRLVAVARSSSGWKTLYRDSIDGRLWELIYPFSEMHGGGPPRLRVISRETALASYGFQSTSE
jgi:hypothetical protein